MNYYLSWLSPNDVGAKLGACGRGVCPPHPRRHDHRNAAPVRRLFGSQSERTEEVVNLSSGLSSGF